MKKVIVRFTYKCGRIIGHTKDGRAIHCTELKDVRKKEARKHFQFKINYPHGRKAKGRQTTTCHECGCKSIIMEKKISTTHEPPPIMNGEEGG